MLMLLLFNQIVFDDELVGPRGRFWTAYFRKKNSRGGLNTQKQANPENNTLGLSLTRSNIVRNGHKSYHVQRNGVNSRIVVKVRVYQGIYYIIWIVHEEVAT